MSLHNIFIKCLTAELSYNTRGETLKFNLFYEEFPEYEYHGEDYNSLMKDIITNVFPNINVNDYYLSKTIYAHIIHLLIDYNNFDLSTSYNTVFYIMLKDTFVSINDRKTLFPLLIPDKVSRYYLQSNIAFLSTLNMRVSIIKYLDSIYSDVEYNFMNEIKEYIENYEDIIIPQEIKNNLTNNDKQIYLSTDDYERIKNENDDYIISFLKYYIEGDKIIKSDIKTKYLSIATSDNELLFTECFDSVSVDNLIGYLDHYINIDNYVYTNYFILIEIDNEESGEKLIKKFNGKVFDMKNKDNIDIKCKLIFSFIKKMNIFD
jgi:hypothetical protein